MGEKQEYDLDNIARIVQAMFNGFKNSDIRNFSKTELRIATGEVEDMIREKMK